MLPDSDTRYLVDDGTHGTASFSGSQPALSDVGSKAAERKPAPH